MAATARQAKIQGLVIRHLMDHGTLDLKLPDGITLEIGIMCEDKKGNLVKSDDYCYVSAIKDDKKILLDSYELGLSFSDEEDRIVLEDEDHDEYGRLIHCVEVV